jgi:hypothetical protein
VASSLIVSHRHPLRRNILQVLINSVSCIYFTLRTFSTGNQAFSEHTHKSSSALYTDPITMFELIDSNSLPALYSMLAMSLHNVPIVEVEIFSPDSFEEGGVLMDDDLEKKPSLSASTHLLITLPCKTFHGSFTRCNITVRHRHKQFVHFCHLIVHTSPPHDVYFFLAIDCFR